MNYTRIVLCAIAATVAYYLFGSIGRALFASYYSQYGAVFRPREMIVGYMPLGFAGTFIAALALAMIYAAAHRGKSGALEGLRFGALIGVFIIGAGVAHDFVILNVGLNLALVEASGQFFGWLLAGIVIGLIYRPLPSPGN
ncbi:MAG TPA: hypothetical protein VNU22_00750 [Candidatus Acidoferrum sp.]|nr:hypothetical protein [Candidatus Acidoferrum sp.]